MYCWERSRRLLGIREVVDDDTWDVSAEMTAAAK